MLDAGKSCLAIGRSMGLPAYRIENIKSAMVRARVPEVIPAAEFRRGISRDEAIELVGIWRRAGFTRETIKLRLIEYANPRRGRKTAFADE